MIKFSVWSFIGLDKMHMDGKKNREWSTFTIPIGEFPARGKYSHSGGQVTEYYKTVLLISLQKMQ